MCHLRLIFPDWLFCLDDLSVAVHGVIRSPGITVFLWVSPFRSVRSCFVFFGAGWLRAYIYWQVVYIVAFSPLWLWNVHLCLLLLLSSWGLFCLISLGLHLLFSGYHLLWVSLSTLSLWVYTCLCSWDVSLGGTIWLGFVFWSNLLLYWWVPSVYIYGDYWHMRISYSHFVFCSLLVRCLHCFFAFCSCLLS